MECISSNICLIQENPSPCASRKQSVKSDFNFSELSFLSEFPLWTLSLLVEDFPIRLFSPLQGDSTHSILLHPVLELGNTNGSHFWNINLNYLWESTAFVRPAIHSPFFRMSAFTAGSFRSREGSPGFILSLIVCLMTAALTKRKKKKEKKTFVVLNSLIQMSMM